MGRKIRNLQSIVLTFSLPIFPFFIIYVMRNFNLSFKLSDVNYEENNGLALKKVVVDCNNEVVILIDCRKAGFHCSLYREVGRRVKIKNEVLYGNLPQLSTNIGMRRFHMAGHCM